MGEYTVSLTVRKGFEAMAFYQKALGTESLVQMGTPETGLWHGEMLLDGKTIYISDEAEEFGAKAPLEGQMAPSLITIEVDDADAAFARAEAAGMKPLLPVADQFWGDRCGTLVDPYGYRWCMNQHLEDLTPEEVQKRAEAIFAQQQ